MEVRLGVRVVRGPDWERGNEDGGEGYVGTVVAGARDDARHDVATVQWDVVGERHVYRCGAQGKFDLRVIDSAPAGVVHRHMECSGCGSESIAGCVWRCLHCLRYYLCTVCYMKDRHSVWHHFMRIDSPENPRQRTRVRCRYQSGRVAARGVFVGARVVRGGDWRWGDQDGGAGREGSVVEIDGWQSESSRSVAVVEWRESGLKRKYRLGHKGKVDVECRVAAEGGHCYLDHLPLLGSEYKPPTTPFICAGDRAKLEMDLDLLKIGQESIDAWDGNIVQFLGEVGVIGYVNILESEAVISYPIRGNKYRVVISAVKRIEGPDILPDDVVRVIDDMAEVHRLQKEHGGWDDDMALALGQLGRLGLLLKDGIAVVWVNGRRWCLNPLCLVPAPGEQPEDEDTEIEDSLPSMNLLWLLEAPNQDLLWQTACRGQSSLMAELLKKWPDQVNAKFDDKNLLHAAASEGRLGVARVLLEHKADLTAKDKYGDTALHVAARFNQYPIAKLLLDSGCDPNVLGAGDNTPMHMMAALGNWRLLKLFLKQPKCQINCQNTFGDTPLHLALQCHWHSTSAILIAAGADVTIVNTRGSNALRHAVTKNFYLGVEMILQAHPDTANIHKTEDGSTALHVTARFSFLDILCLLASLKSCDVDCNTLAVQTPLHVTTREGHAAALEKLVGYGADVSPIDGIGNTPLHYVLAKRNMTSLDGTQHLSEFHEYVSSADNRIQSVPVYVTVACFLVSEGASLERESFEGLTPISFCDDQYRSLLQLFARPDRKGHFRGSLPRYQHCSSSSVGGVCVAGITATPPVKVATPTSNESVSETKTPDQQSQNSSSETGPSCFLCEGPCDITFQPCGHTAMCAECAEPVKRCPTCKINILEKLKIS